MHHLGYTIWFVFLCLLPRVIHSQSVIQIEKRANEFFQNKQFELAKTDFQQLLARDPISIDYNFKYAVCLYFSNDRMQSKKYFSFLATQPNPPCENAYYLGKIYQYEYNFDRAIQWYKAYLTCAPSKGALPVNQEIQSCKSGKALLKKPKALSVVTKTSTLSDLFYKKYNYDAIGGGAFEDAELQSKTDKKRGYIPHYYFKKGEKIKIFSSYNESSGQLDLYFITKVTPDTWSKPVLIQSLSEEKADKCYPFFDPMSETLYFSSNGYNTMGGFDLFKTTFDPSSNTTGAVVNLDFPFSSVEDDFYFIPLDSLNQMAAFASTRNSAKGKIEIYEVKLEDFSDQIIYLKGQIVDQVDPQNKTAQVTVVDETDGKVYGPFPTDKDGNYNVILPGSGTYRFLVKVDGSDQTFENKKYIPNQKVNQVFAQNIAYVMQDGIEKAEFSYEFDVQEMDAIAFKMGSVSSMTVAPRLSIPNNNAKSGDGEPLVANPKTSTLKNEQSVQDWIRTLDLPDTSINAASKWIADALLDYASTTDDLNYDSKSLTQAIAQQQAIKNALASKINSLSQQVEKETNAYKKKVMLDALVPLLDSLVTLEVSLQANQWLLDNINETLSTLQSSGDATKAERMSDRIKLLLLNDQDDSLMQVMVTEQNWIENIITLQKKDSSKESLDKRMLQQKERAQGLEDLEVELMKTKRTFEANQEKIEALKRENALSKSQAVPSNSLALDELQQQQEVLKAQLSTDTKKFQALKHDIEFQEAWIKIAQEGDISLDFSSESFTSNLVKQQTDASLIEQQASVLVNQTELYPFAKEKVLNQPKSTETMAFQQDILEQELALINQALPGMNDEEIETAQLKISQLENALQELNETSNALANKDNPTNNLQGSSQDRVPEENTANINSNGNNGTEEKINLDQGAPTEETIPADSREKQSPLTENSSNATKVPSSPSNTESVKASSENQALNTQQENNRTIESQPLENSNTNPSVSPENNSPSIGDPERNRLETQPGNEASIAMGTLQDKTNFEEGATEQQAEGKQVATDEEVVVNRSSTNNETPDLSANQPIDQGTPQAPEPKEKEPTTSTPYDPRPTETNQSNKRSETNASNDLTPDTKTDAGLQVEPQNDKGTTQGESNNKERIFLEEELSTGQATTTSTDVQENEGNREAQKANSTTEVTQMDGGSRIAGGNETSSSPNMKEMTSAVKQGEEGIGMDPTVNSLSGIEKEMVAEEEIKKWESLVSTGGDQQAQQTVDRLKQQQSIIQYLIKTEQEIGKEGFSSLFSPEEIRRIAEEYQRSVEAVNGIPSIAKQGAQSIGISRLADQPTSITLPPSDLPHFEEVLVNPTSKEAWSTSEAYDSYITQRKAISQQWEEIQNQTRHLDSLKSRWIQLVSLNDSESELILNQLLDESKVQQNKKEAFEKAMNQLNNTPNATSFNAMISEGILPKAQERTASALRYNKDNVAFSVDRNASPSAGDIPFLSPLPQGLVFTVQVGAFRKPVPSKAFSSLTPVNAERLSNGLVCIIAGFFENSSSANAARKQIRNGGFSDAFLVSYCDGERIPLYQALEMERRGGCSVRDNSALLEEVATLMNDANGKSESSIGEEVYITVQVAALKSTTSESKFNGIEDLFYTTSSSGLVKYASGKFTNLDEANARKKDVRQRGFSDAYLVAYRGGKPISLAEAKGLIAQQEEAKQRASFAKTEPINQDLNAVVPAPPKPVFYYFSQNAMKPDRNSLSNYNQTAGFSYRSQTASYVSGPYDQRLLSPLFWSSLAPFSSERLFEIPPAVIVESNSAVGNLAVLHDYLMKHDLSFCFIQNGDKIQCRITPNEDDQDAMIQYVEKLGLTYTTTQ